MRIGSFNIRGLGRTAKKEEVRSFFFKSKLDVCCDQESKMVAFSEA